MPVPEALASEIRATAARFDVDADEFLHSLDVLVGNDPYAAFTVFGGPGYGQPTVKVDVWVLSTDVLYNYCVLTPYPASSSVYLLRWLDHLSFVEVGDANSPYVIFVGKGEHPGSIFGAPGEKLKTELLMKQILEATRKA